MDEPSRRNNDGEAVTKQGNDSALRKIAAERKRPKGKGRMTKLGFDCGLLTTQCMVQEWPRYHVNSFTMWVVSYSSINSSIPK